MSAGPPGPLGAGQPRGSKAMGAYRPMTTGHPGAQRAAAGGLCGSEAGQERPVLGPRGTDQHGGRRTPAWLRRSETSCGRETTQFGRHGVTLAGTRGPVGMVRTLPPAVQHPVQVQRPPRPHRRDPGTLTAEAQRDQEALPAADQARGPHSPGRSGLRGRGLPWARSPDPPSRGAFLSLARRSGGRKKGL